MDDLQPNLYVGEEKRIEEWGGREVERVKRIVDT